MKKLSLILWSVLLLGMGGCSDFLEPQSSDEYVPEDAEALNEMLLGNAYISWQNPRNLYLYHNVFSDDVTVTDAPVGFHEYDKLKGDAYFSLYTMQPDMFVGMETSGVGQICWDDYYEVILGCNAALDYLDGMRGTEDMKRYVAAQALGLRAYYYFQFVNLFGAPYNASPDALGVPLKLTSDLTVDHMSRNTVKEVYAQVNKDLRASDSLFCMLPSGMQFEKDYRMSLPGVRLLRSRVNLYMENWEEAVRWADSVLVWKEFSLYDLTSFVAGTPADGLPAMPNFSDYSNTEVIWCNGSVFDFRTLLDNMCEDENADPTMRVKQPFFNASPELLATYDKNLTGAEEDLRKKFYILDAFNQYGQATGRKRAIGKMPLDSRYYYQAISDNVGLAVSFRLSEVYLNLAEAHAMLGNSGDALYYLNELRKMRIKDCQNVAGLSGENLIQFVRDERRRELCFEGYRWFDQRRWGMESFTRKWKQFSEEYSNYVIEKNDPAFTLPIPNEVIVRNPRIEQNPLAKERHPSL